ncbi:AMP-dependent synthetase/ligase [Streptomyces sp. BI20]|uniref:AMP-dependent synthetase/ligase n=1 Tax=Streptomyces sp. BI20 TaxID=3403460 RepID=UPI003C75316E
MREFTTPTVLPHPPVGGLADVVFERARRDPERVVLWRPAAGGWRELTARGFADEVTDLARGLLAREVRFGDRVGLMARTRWEWTLFDFALWAIGAVPVPLYPNSSAEQARWILADAGCSACVVEDEDQAMTVGSVVDGLPRLRALWQIDPGPADRRPGAVAELTAAGASVDPAVVWRHREAVRAETEATVIHTSGTTGPPRGCVLTHANLMFEADTLVARWGEAFGGSGREPASTLLFLPAAHVFGRVAQVAAVRGGVRFGHAPNTSAAALAPALAALRPTFLPAVPHLFEKVFAGARREAESRGRGAAFDRAVDTAVRYARAREERAFGVGPGPSAGLRMEHRVFERVVYGPLRETLGGRVRSAMSGGSAMPRRLGLFFEGAGITVFEGYGLTESTGAATANPPGAVRYGTVGPPVPGTSVHVAGDGEVWLRGPHVFAGHLDGERGVVGPGGEGWFATGDLGSLDEEGYLTLTGRKKDILVTSNGKNVAPAVLEERVRAHPLVHQCLVSGNDRPYVVALVTLDADAVAHWLSMRGRSRVSAAEAARDAALSAELTAEVRRAVVAANALVSRAEGIRRFRVVARPFTEEGGLLTPSLKPRRRAIEEAYAREIAELYAR